MQREPPKNSQSKSSKTIGFLQKKQRFPAKKIVSTINQPRCPPTTRFFSAWSPDLSIDPWRSTTLEFLSLEVPVSAGAGPWLDWIREETCGESQPNAHLTLTKNVHLSNEDMYLTSKNEGSTGSDLTKKELIISVYCIHCIIASWVLKGGLSSKHGNSIATTVI